MNHSTLEISEALGFPIGQTIGEIQVLRKYASLVPEMCSIIDIGTRNGGSAIILAMSSKSQVYSIDILDDPRCTDYGYQEIPPLREHWDSFPFGDRIHQITCNTKDFKGSFGPVGLVFIDGDHTYEGILQDWYHFYPMIEEGGYILCHDYDKPKFPGVTAFLDRISREIDCIDLVDSIAVFRKGEEDAS